MDIDAIRKHCLSLPHATEQVQWGADLVFKVDGKMFAVAPLEIARVCLSFKCSPQNFVELCERPGIIPAPYMARAQWVALEKLGAVPDAELRELLAESYRLVWERLPKRCQAALAGGAAKSAKRAATKTGKGTRRSAAKQGEARGRRK